MRLKYFFIARRRKAPRIDISNDRKDRFGSIDLACILTLTFAWNGAVMGERIKTPLD